MENPLKRYIKRNYVSKKKIQEAIQRLDKEMQKPEKQFIYANYRYAKNILEELLEK